MDTARRLGAFSLTLSFLLYILFDLTEASGLSWRGQLLVYSILTGILGLFLLYRYRPQPPKSGRFQGIKNFLFRYSTSRSKDRQRGRGRKDRDRRSGRRGKVEEED